MPFDVRKSYAFPKKLPEILRLRRRSEANITGQNDRWAETGGIAAYKLLRLAGEAQLRRTSTGEARKAKI